ncbi:hypothetical protein GWI33_005858 [Rhynchophorus ferrugineus]|uniref:Uncharacterized protein n=1 Tax=Rhynchophorus ferrugineus TaxID=354439 RepID=A0A834IM98_RHYFE|nr:hypothetical protein GWI33_005858 [Rhynchophorus ferrugineus]
MEPVVVGAASEGFGARWHTNGWPRCTSGRGRGDSASMKAPSPRQCVVGPSIDVDSVQQVGTEVIEVRAPLRGILSGDIQKGLRIVEICRKDGSQIQSLVGSLPLYECGSF